MNWGQFKDPVSHMCLAVTVASWSLMQEVAGSSRFTVMTNISVTDFAEFSENIYEKLKCLIGYIKNCLFNVCVLIFLLC